MIGPIRIFVLGLVVVGALVLASKSTAQEPKGFDPLSVQAELGVAFGFGQIGNYVDYGFHGRAGVVWRPSETIPEVSTVMSASYQYFPGSVDSSGDFGILAGSVDLKFTPKFDSPSRFYLLAGGGVGSISLKSAALGQFLAGDKNSQTGLLAELGGGLEYANGSGTDYFVEAKVVNIFSKQFGDYRFATVSIGMTF